MSCSASSLSKTATEMAIYPHQTAWIQRVSRMSLEATNDVVLDDATTNARPTGLRVNTDIRSRAYHERIAQAHLNEKDKGKDHPYDDDNDDLVSEGYLHAKGNLEKYMEDPGRLRSPMRDKKEEMESQNANDKTAAASDHASAGNSPPKDGNEVDPSFSSPFYRGGGIKLKRNNSNSAELMLKGVSSRGPTPSQSPHSPGETSGHSLDGYFESCEDCFVAGIRCAYFAGPLRFVPDYRGGGSLGPDGGGRDGHGVGRATSERHEWLVGRMNESLAKIDCAGNGGSGGVVPRGGA